MRLSGSHRVLERKSYTKYKQKEESKKQIPSVCFKLQINSISKVTCGSSVATLFIKMGKKVIQVQNSGVYLLIFFVDVV